MKQESGRKGKDKLVIVKLCLNCENECKIFSLPSAILYCRKYKKKKKQNNEETTIYNV